ncbi:LysM peptidoglycan-binding domain-containing protein [Yoonia sp. 2307UL14-13]|uniref:LysM peptidoglycan-binding domain-containing protein n=1 Tax=Yoonia sp. 2307UL14-13 TaxID=3126506 RepID=UPI00309C1587
MSEAEQSNATRIAAGVIAALALGVSAFVLLPMFRSQPMAPATDPVAAVEPETAATEVAGPPPPRFDTFRVETDGSMVVAGRAEPGQIVDILLAGAAIERVTADDAGSFVAFPVAGPSEKPRILSLLADPDGAAIESEVTYIVAPIAAPPPPSNLPEAPAGPELTAAAEAPPTLSDEDTAGAVSSATPTLGAAEGGPPTLPTVLQADADGIRVVQAAPSAAAAIVDQNVVLDAITYDPAGDVLLSGRAVGDGAVQIYLDNEPVTTSPVEEGGDWRIGLPDIDTGVYTLRIDEVDEEGAVVSRIETPFKREEADDVAAVLAEETAREGFEVAVKTVQPGATLWAIAEENLGDGILYVAVFEANADLIKDPDLIYPGQIFRIPDIGQ